MMILSLVHQPQTLVLSAAECGFESRLLTLVPLSKALYRSCFVTFWEVVHSALPTTLLVDDTHVYYLSECEGVTVVSASRSSWQLVYTY